MVIAIAIVAVIVVLFTIIFFHELGHFVAARAAGVKVLEFGIGFPPRLFAVKRGDTLYSFNLILLGAFVKPLGEQDPTIQGSLAGKSPWIRMGVNAAGPVANGLLAFVLLAVSLMIPTEVIVGGEGVKVMRVTEGSPAMEVGILPGDVILRINEREISDFEEMRNAIDEAEGVITVLLQRGGEQIPISLQPAVDPETGQKLIGVGIWWVTPYTEKQRYPFLQAFALSGKVLLHTPSMLRDVIVAVKESPGESVVGPIGAAQITGEMAKFGLSAIVAMAATLSLGIGLFNLFPIPPLDGGGILVAGLEGIRRGKRLSPRAMRLAYAIGTALLVSIFIVITYNDILRLIRGESLLP